MILHYVEAQKLDGMEARKMVGGPYESGLEALEMVDKLAALYPGCAVRKASKSVPMKKAALLLGSPKIEERTNA